MINNFIETAFEGKLRKTGEPYVTHLYAVRDILQSVGIESEYILNAALLHDILEDTEITKHELEKHFGKAVSNMVEWLSKSEMWHTSYCKLKSYVHTLEKIAVLYPEVILIKMADRAHNLQTISAFSDDKKREYIKETTDYLFPIFFQAAYYAPKKTPYFLLKNLLQQELAEISNNLKKNEYQVAK